MRTIAVLPIKSFRLAKQRLSAAVEGGVLAGLAAVDGLAEVIVVTAEPLAVRAAEEAGALVVHDPEETGQSPAAARGVDAAVVRGAERVLLVPGACPALEADEVPALRAGGEPAPSVAIVPDRHGTGTNALLLAPPGAVAPAFGPGSFARHAAFARAAAR